MPKLKVRHDRRWDPLRETSTSRQLGASMHKYLPSRSHNTLASSTPTPRNLSRTGTGLMQLESTYVTSEEGNGTAVPSSRRRSGMKRGLHIFYDCETAGPGPLATDIIEMGAVVSHPRGRRRTFSGLVKTDQPITCAG
jgi:hypothetical protein